MTDGEFARALGRKVKAARDAAGLTLDRAAARCRVGRSTLCDVEGAAQNSTYVSTLRRIAAGLGVGLGVGLADLMPEAPPGARHETKGRMMPHAETEEAAPAREARYRAGARADADRNGETMFLVWHPENGPRTATGALRDAGPYWTALSVAEPWEREQGERVDPAGAPAPCPECRQRILDEIQAERARQVELGFDAEHDARHSLEQWIVNLSLHLGLAGWDGSPADVCHLTEATRPYDPARYRKQLVRVAAVAVAALEAFDRKAAAAKGGGDDAG